MRTKKRALASSLFSLILMREIGLPCVARPASSTIAAAAGATISVASTKPGWGTLRHRARLIHNQRSAKEILAVAGRDGFVSFGIVIDLNESESTRFAGKPILNDTHRLRLEARLRKPIFQLTLASLIRQIANK